MKCDGLLEPDISRGPQLPEITIHTRKVTREVFFDDESPELCASLRSDLSLERPSLVNGATWDSCRPLVFAQNGVLEPSPASPCFSGITWYCLVHSCHDPCRDCQGEGRVGGKSFRQRGGPSVSSLEFWIKRRVPSFVQHQVLSWRIDCLDEADQRTQLVNTVDH